MQGSVHTHPGARWNNGTPDGYLNESPWVSALSLDEISGLKRLLNLMEQRKTRVTACQQVLHGWVGTPLAATAMKVLVTEDVPDALMQGINAQREAHVHEQAGQQRYQEFAKQRQELASQLTGLEERFQKDQLTLRQRGTRLDELVPLAQQVLMMRARQRTARTRLEEQRRGTISALWNTLSGQASAAQLEITRLQARHDSLLGEFQKARDHRGLQRDLQPEHVEVLRERERQAMLDLQEWAKREKQALRDRLSTLNEREREVQGGVARARAAAERCWREVQHQHQIPDWPAWEPLWSKRREVLPLWLDFQAALHAQEEATRAMEVVWATWGTACPDPALLRSQLDAAEVEGLARQEQERREAAERQTRELRGTFVGVIEQRRATLAAQASTLREHEARSTLVHLLEGRCEQILAHLATERASRPRRPRPAVSTVHLSVHSSPPEAAEGAAEVLHDSGGFFGTPLLPPSPAPPAAGDTALGGPGSTRPAEVHGKDRGLARHMLSRHAASAARAAMCLEALQEWGGPGVDPVALATLLSGPLPAELEGTTHPSLEDDAASGAAPEAGWSVLAARHGLPDSRARWRRLWTTRAKGLNLLEGLTSARDAMAEQESGMASLWQAWPEPLRNVRGLRQAVEYPTGEPAPLASAVSAKSVDRPAQAPPPLVTRSVKTLSRPPSVHPGVDAPPRADVASPLPERGPSPSRPRPGEVPLAAVTATPGPVMAQVAQGTLVAASSRSRTSTFPDSVLNDVRASGERAHGLLRTHLSVTARMAMCEEGLNDWAGSGVDGLALGEFVARPLPADVVAALEDERDDKPPGVSSSAMNRQEIGAMIESERQRASKALGPLRLLQLDASPLIQAEQELWRTTKGSHRRKELRLSAAREAYEARSRALGFATPPPPRDLAGLIATEEQAFAARMAPLESAWQDATREPAEPPAESERGIEGASRPEARARWADLSRRHRLPPQQERFEALWRQRGRGQALWQQWQGANEELRLIEAGLAELWADWPLALQTVDCLQDILRAVDHGANEPVVTLTGTREEKSSEPPRVAAVRPPPPAPWVTSPRGAAPPAAAVVMPPAPSPVLQPVSPRPGTVVSRAPGPPLDAISRPPPPRTTAAALPSPSSSHSFPGGPGQIPLAAPPPVGPRVVAARPAPLPGTLRPPLPAPARQAPSLVDPSPLGPRGRLTRRERAEREAVRISEQYNWARGFVLLADAFDRDQWGQLRLSIEREIERGMTPEEFELVLQMRAYWHDQVHFQASSSARYDSLPWELGLRLIRRTAGIPCLDEMIILIERFYALAEVLCSRRALPAFAQRLGLLVEEADPGIDLEYWLCVQEARCSFR